MSYKVNATDLRKIQLNESDTIASVLQNVAILLSTRQKSIPLYREFGLPMQFLDRPIPVAKVLAISEIKEVVERFEPRVTVVGVTFQEKSEKLVPTVEVELNEP